MWLPWALVLTVLAHNPVFGVTPAKRSYLTHNYYVLEHAPSVSHGASLADVALALGVEVIEQVGELKDHWLVRAPIPDLSARSGDFDPVLDMLESLRVRAGVIHTHMSSRSEDVHNARAVVSSLRYVSRQTLRQRVKRAPPPIRPPGDSQEEKPTPAQNVASRLGIQDPMFPNQWHLVNNDNPEHMMNVTPVWEMGFTGKGVISSIVDDGLDYTSEDLAENFDGDNSYDFNDHERLPTPKKFDDHHGTRCAGQIAAGKNNACGLGIAYNSKIAGVRILSGPISDADEATALNYGFQNVSVYSCSWGPPDNGQAMEGPDYLIKKAFVNGINNGRAGKGSVFVFASGNGAANNDQCNFDGYTNSIYSVTVSAVDFKGLHPYYSEPCAANMIVAYSSGSGKHIVTTDKGKNECTTSHGGTSAAAPNAAGVLALVLEARPDLTWRDVQYLCIESARMINPEDPDWEQTATGKRYSYKYGYGALDAYQIVKAAQSWTLVKPQAWFETKAVQLNGGTMGEDQKFSGGQFIGEGGVKSTISVTTQMLTDNNFQSLEHINVRVWIQHTARGDVEVEIVSPKGIKSILAKARPSDRATSGYPGWVFMSVKHWGEDPVGDWTVTVTDPNKPELSNGTFLGWNMKFWGTTIDPSKAKQYEVPLVEGTLPPQEERPTPPTPTTSKVLSKPTDNLPSDHGTAEGENTNPAFSSVSSGPTATSSPTPDVGWFPDMANLVSNQKWFFVAAGAVVLFGIGTAIFFWRRRRARLANYATLPGRDDLSMSAFSSRGVSAGSSRPTKELYDAFGEVSDDEDDADETQALRGARPRDGVSAGLGFHSGFLDDDEQPTASGSPTPVYRDEPQGAGHSHHPRDPSGISTPTDSGGSWEHASST